MTVVRYSAFSGDTHQLKQLLIEFAKLSRARFIITKEQTFKLLFGDTLSLNPNTLRFSIFITYKQNRVQMESRCLTLPHMQKKFFRVIDFRLNQLQDFINTREIKNEIYFAKPFAVSLNSFRSIGISLGFFILSLLLCLGFCFLATLLMGYVLMDDQINFMRERALSFKDIDARELFLPRLVELLDIDTGFKLNCAILFSAPIALFIGLTLGGFLIFSEIFVWLSRNTLLFLLFFALLLLLGLIYVMPVPLAIFFCIFVPLLSYLGYSIGWALKKEHKGIYPIPALFKISNSLLFVFFILIVVVILVPPPGTYAEDIALFRDRFLLGCSFGKTIAEFYYKHTLYPAEILKPFYSTRTIGPPQQREREPQRQQRYALMIGQDATLHNALRTEGFFVFEKKDIWQKVPLKFFDVCFIVEDEKEWQEICRQGSSKQAVFYTNHKDLKDRLVLQKPLTRDKLQGVLNKVSFQNYRAEYLREVSRLGWFSIYFGLIPFITFLFIALAVFIFSISSKTGRILLLPPVLVIFAYLINWVVGYYQRPAKIDKIIKQIEASGATGIVKNYDADIRFELYYRIASILKHKKDRKWLDLLMMGLKDTDLRVRFWSCAGLGELGDRTAIDELIKALKDPEIFVRYKSAEALGRIGDRRAIEHLKERIQEDIWYVGSYAFDALLNLAR